MKYSHLPAWRQQIWSCLHFPFHVALVVFMQGFTQFVIWSKVFDVINRLRLPISDSYEEIAGATSVYIKNILVNRTNEFFDQYTPTYIDTWQVVDSALNNLTDIPDGFWPQLAEYQVTLDEADMPPVDQYQSLQKVLNAILYAMVNSLFESFDIDLTEDLLEEDPDAKPDQIGFQRNLSQETVDRYVLVVRSPGHFMIWVFCMLTRF